MASPTKVEAGGKTTGLSLPSRDGSTTVRILTQVDDVNAVGLTGPGVEEVLGRLLFLRRHYCEDHDLRVCIGDTSRGSLPCRIGLACFHKLGLLL